MKNRTVMPFFLAISDLLVFNISPILAGLLLFFISGDIDRYIPADEVSSRLICYFFISLISISWFWLRLRHYQERPPFWFELKGILGVLVVLSIIDLAIVAFSKWNLSRYLWIYTWFFILTLVPVSRFFIKFLWRRFGSYKIRAVIFGGGQNALEAYQVLSKESYLGYDFIAVVCSSEEENLLKGLIPCLTRFEDIKELPDYRRIQYFIATDGDQEGLREYWIRSLTNSYCRSVSIIPATRGIPINNTKMSFLFSQEMLILGLNTSLTKPVSRVLKRFFDFIVSLLLLVVLSPVFLILGVLISRDGGAPIYGHERVGQDGKKFKCLKFRSMVRNSQKVLQDLLENDPAAREEWEKDFKLKNDPRITSLGDFIRKTSLDELPQLFNVLIGQMSLVGPRPIVEEELARYKENVDYYLLAKPGMTGLWQVSGRNDVDYDKRVYFDAWYVKNWSLWNDIAILFKTVKVVFVRSGAY